MTYYYRSNERRLYSSAFRYYDECGHIYTQNYNPTTWSALISAMKDHYHSRLIKETWEIVCADSEVYPELNTKEFKEFKHFVETEFIKKADK